MFRRGRRANARGAPGEQRTGTKPAGKASRHRRGPWRRAAPRREEGAGMALRCACAQARCVSVA
ncbi:hypothetical protein A176_006563 [Myxococcus hansupus]|uniref:Uncharacterized protein n=1 Tax=Pseudomyxococcus hansupus TaxID=1297742 RepID=A0A0H4X1W0_9BACT|nr:hypothetical protein A176_006563 [Myxococcus hansupus]